MKILIVEDEKELRKSEISYLSDSGYLCESAANYKEACAKINDYDYDCIVVDIGLPDGSGLRLIEEIKERELQSGIIIVSAKNSLEDRLMGLELGSDDYLTKPFHLSELLARIKSIIRRRNFQGRNEILFDVLKIYPDSYEVFVSERAIKLTSKEFDLLVFFIANKGRVLPKDSIAEHLWGDYMDQSNSFDFLYTHVKNLKKKLEAAGCKDYLKSIYGVGYKFSEE